MVSNILVKRTASPLRGLSAAYLGRWLFRGTSQMKGKTVLLITLAVVLVLCVLAYTQLTIFVIQPIGAIPEGKTLVISRLNKTNFVDSADGMCQRIQGGVSLLCRGMVMGAVAKNATVYLRLPYSETLYQMSTDGKTYDR